MDSSPLKVQNSSPGTSSRIRITMVTSLNMVLYGIQVAPAALCADYMLLR